MQKNTFCLTLILLLGFFGFSQVQVGSDTNFNTSQYIPFRADYKYSYSQSIYLASEINATGTITGIRWYYTNTTPTDLANSQDLTIYIGTTSNTSFASTTDWITSGLAQVYTGGITTNTTSGWKTITFTTPFVYDGLSNLVIAVDKNGAGADNFNDKFRNLATGTTNRSIAYFNQTVDADPSGTLPTASNTRAFVPNIIFDGISQGCPTPANLIVSSIGTTTATITWDAALLQTPSGGSDYYYSTTNTPPTGNTTVSGSVPSGTTANLSTLTAATKYYVWVRNNCGSGDLSSWSTSASFVTLCNQTASINENFDTTIVPQIPVCWSKIIRGPSINPTATVIETISSTTNQVHSSPNSLRMFNSDAGTDVNDIILVTPSISTLNTGQYRLKFYAKQSDLTGGLIQIGTLDSNTSTAIFTPLSTNSGNVNITNSAAEYTVNIDNYTGNDTYIGFKMRTGSNFTTTFLDDIRWELIPACYDVSDIVLQNVTGTTATVSWNTGGTPGGVETSWDVAVGPSSATDPNGLLFTNTAITLKNITGLDSQTDYQVWVRSVCTVGGVGEWVGPVSFTTDCPSLSTLHETFDGYTVPQQQQYTEDIPSCWTKIIRGAAYKPQFTYIHTTSKIASQTSSIPNSIEMANSDATPTSNDIILVTPPLSTLSLGTYRLKFHAKQNVIIAPASVIIGTLNNGTNTAKFTPYQTVSISTTATEYVVSFSGYITSDTRIGIKMNSQDTVIFTYIDDVTWELEPSCADVTDIAIPDTTPTGATVSWIANGGESQWQVAVGSPSVTDPNTLTPLPANKITLSISGLNSSTKYQVWVRSNCTENEFGSWIGPVFFTTPCPAITSLNENFDSTGSLPACWSTLLRGSTPNAAYSVININTNPQQSNSAPNSAYLHKGDYEDSSHGLTALSDVILITPRLSNISSGTYRLRFYATFGTQGSVNPTKIQIGTISSNTDSAVFTALGNEIALTNKMAEYTINFDSVFTTDPYIAFRISLKDACSAYIDNVRWDLIPTCPEVSEIAIDTSTPSSASLVWTVGGTETSWDVVYGTSTVTDPNGLTPTTVPNPYTTIPDLTTSTAYNVWVRANCGDPLGSSPWVGPFSFTTPCLGVPTLSEYVDTTTVPNLPNCWTKILRGTTLANTALINSTTNESYSSSNSILMRSNSSKAEDDIILVSPNLSSLSAGTHTLKFYAKSEVQLLVGTLNNNTNSAQFNLIQIINPVPGPISGASGLPTAIWSEYTVPFTSYTGEDTYIGIRMDTSTPSHFVYIDNIRFDNENLGTNEWGMSQLSYYPNPVKDILNVSYINSISSVSVYNLLGQKVITNSVNNNSTQIDMSGLSNGTYMVKVSVGDTVETIKVLKL